MTPWDRTGYNILSRTRVHSETRNDRRPATGQQFIVKWEMISDQRPDTKHRSMVRLFREWQVMDDKYFGINENITDLWVKLEWQSSTSAEFGRNGSQSRLVVNETISHNAIEVTVLALKEICYSDFRIRKILKTSSPTVKLTESRSVFPVIFPHLIPTITFHKKMYVQPIARKICLNLKYVFLWQLFKTTECTSNSFKC